jgi:hypothetical protein
LRRCRRSVPCRLPSMSCHSIAERATGLENWTAVEDGPGRVKKGLKEGGGRQRIYASRSGGSSCWEGRVDGRAVCRGRVEQAQSPGQTRQCRCSLHRAVEVWSSVGSRAIGTARGRSKMDGQRCMTESAAALRRGLGFIERATGGRYSQVQSGPETG